MTFLNQANRNSIRALLSLSLLVFVGCAMQTSVAPVKRVEVKRDDPIILFYGQRLAQRNDGKHDVRKAGTRPTPVGNAGAQWQPVIIRPKQRQLSSTSDKSPKAISSSSPTGLGVKKITSATTSKVNKVTSQDKPLPPAEVTVPRFYQVKAGDNLYRIAKTRNLDLGALASANQLKWPFQLSVGQEILLDGFAIDKRQNRPDSHNNQGELTKLSASTHKSVQNSQKGNKNKQLDKKLVYQKNSFLSEKKARIENQGKLTWVWPTQGKLVKPFNRLTRGVDFSGEPGDPVSAAAEGKVVYAGDGLVGYGNLLILEHPNGFLSAYAHNSRLLVKEGYFVKAGQVIAELGSSGTDKNKLHFEIRKEGKPVDPFIYLPTKRA